MGNFIKASLLFCLCFCFMITVFAASATLEYNDSKVVKKEVGVDFYTRVVVNDLSTSKPTIINKVQAKNLLSWETGTSQSFVAQQTNANYFLYYNQTKTNTIKSTWTNASAGTRIGGDFNLFSN